MEINLLYLADAPYGGWVTFTTHLAKALESCGNKVRILKVSKKTESKTRKFCDGLFYQNVSFEAVNAICKPNNTIITALSKTKHEMLETLLPLNPVLVLHDPAEMTATSLALAKNLKRPIVAIRKMPAKELQTAGLESVFIRHPFVSSFNEPQCARSASAVSVCRLDWDKNIDIICESNTIAETKVRMYGALNSIYGFHKLAKKFPDWKKDYFGTFPKEENAAISLIFQHKACVDLSLIKLDGGGTQYTFLEAWQARTLLIIHKDWLQPGDDMVNGENCLAVANAGELKDVLDGPLPVLMGAENSLRKHDSTTIVKNYLSLLNS